jgi:hypothetical protein
MPSPAVSLAVILFTGLFAITVLLLSRSSFPHLAHSFSNSSAATDNQTLVPSFKEMPVKVKEFILNNIVNKSKAAIVVGLIDLNGTKVYSFGNVSKANNIPVIE